MNTPLLNKLHSLSRAIAAVVAELNTTAEPDPPVTAPNEDPDWVVTPDLVATALDLDKQGRLQAADLPTLLQWCWEVSSKAGALRPDGTIFAIYLAGTESRDQIRILWGPKKK